MSKAKHSTNKEHRMTKVVICGPNLRNQGKGQFHVHVDGCADLKRMLKREPEYGNGWSVDVDSRQDIVEHIYDDHMAEWERDHPTESLDWREYDDIYLFPCVELPELRPDEPEEDDEEEGEEEVPDPYAEVIELAKKHGGSDGKLTADEAMSQDAMAGYLDENLDDEMYGEASTYDLDRIASTYVAAFLKGFTEQVRATLKEFLEDEAMVEQES